MAYADGTAVSFDKSMAEIITALRKAGAGQIAQADLEIEYVLQFSLDSRTIRFRLPVPGVLDMPTRDGRGSLLTDDQRQSRANQVKRQRGRALLLVIKAKLESIESKIESTEQAFLANVVMASGTTVYEQAAPQIALEYETGHPSVLLLGAPS